MKDLSENGEEFIASYGGNGGWGNGKAYAHRVQHSASFG